MARYFFDIDDGERSFTDVDGLEMVDREAVRRAAIDVLPDVARDELPDGDRRSFICNVRNKAGKVIFRASLSLEAGWLES